MIQNNPFVIYGYESKEYLIVRQEGNRNVRRQMSHYNLDIRMRR